ncbi:hypothetical protein HDU97_005090 [Phlyctochytrium planicorne]|nr:hypothetical protein HDU97_005090 [Phlyctochytrium planicorne]
MGECISRDSRHKRSATGAKRAQYRKKRKFELGRQAAQTKIGVKRIHTIRVRGGNLKYRALRLESGNYSWASEHCTRKTRVIEVKYNSTNNELVRTNTLVKGCIVNIDATPFRQWFESHYATPLGRRNKKVAEGQEDAVNKARSNHVTRKVTARKEGFKVDPALEEQFATGRLLAMVSSRPGQSGRVDGYVLEGKELDFYMRKIRSKLVKNQRRKKKRKRIDNFNVALHATELPDGEERTGTHAIAEEKAKVAAFVARSGLALPQSTLIEALTHRSHKDASLHVQSDRFHLLGEKVVGFLVSEYVFSKYPTLPSQAMSSLVDSYTSSYTMANIGKNLGVPSVMRSSPHTDFSSYIKIGKDGIEKESKVLGKMVLSLIGALYSEQGMKAAKGFVSAHILSREMDVSLHLKLANPKGLLRDVLKKLQKPSPVSRLLKETGRLSSTPVFIVGVYSGVEKLGEGYGSSMAMAETRAARNAIEKHFSEEVKDFKVHSDEVAEGDGFVFVENNA